SPSCSWRRPSSSRSSQPSIGNNSTSEPSGRVVGSFNTSLPLLTWALRAVITGKDTDEGHRAQMVGDVRSDLTRTYRIPHGAAPSRNTDGTRRPRSGPRGPLSEGKQQWRRRESNPRPKSPP